MNQRQRAIAEDRAGQEVNLAVERAEFARRIKKARKTETAILDGVRSADCQGRPIIFQAYRTFSTLFESATLLDTLSGYKSTAVHTWKVDEQLNDGRVRSGTGDAVLDSFCSVSGVKGHLWFDVRPRKAVIDAIGSRMMLCDRYRINFEVVVRNDDTALVTAKYNLISGSRWLALIHSDTIPGLRT